jgi:retron-type reverse transcriptase
MSSRARHNIGRVAVAAGWVLPCWSRFSEAVRSLLMAMFRTGTLTPTTASSGLTGTMPLRAWRLFLRGKSRQPAVRRFWLRMERNLTSLYHDLTSNRYTHGPYKHFTVNDTKRRDIYVARVRDRIVHQLLTTYIEKIYQPLFISHSFAAQKGKGVTAARQYAFDVISSIQKQGLVWIGKMDVEKYFANIDHEILLHLLSRRVKDAKILNLCEIVLKSFGNDGRGLPLGNLTSQWFANIYLHELDWYAQHTLDVRHYMRYNDDVLIMCVKEVEARQLTQAIVKFVNDRLRLIIPERKTEIVNIPGGSVDVLGIETDGFGRWVRIATEKRAKRLLDQKYERQSPEFLDAVCSYLGYGITSDVAFSFQ